LESSGTYHHVIGWFLSKIEMIACEQRVRFYGRDLKRCLVKLPVVKLPTKLGRQHRYVPLFHLC
jgi:hypothetical protein